MTCFDARQINELIETGLKLQAGVLYFLTEAALRVSELFLLVDGARQGMYRVEVEGAIVGEAVASKEGRLRFKADSPEGQAIAAAEKSGLEISVVEA